MRKSGEILEPLLVDRGGCGVSETTEAITAAWPGPSCQRCKSARRSRRSRCARGCAAPAPDRERCRASTPPAERTRLEPPGQNHEHPDQPDQRVHEGPAERPGRRQAGNRQHRGQRVGEHMHIGGAVIRILVMCPRPAHDHRPACVVVGMVVMIVVVVVVMRMAVPHGRAHDRVRGHGFRAAARRSPGLRTARAPRSGPPRENGWRPDAAAAAPIRSRCRARSCRG